MRITLVSMFLFLMLSLAACSQIENEGKIKTYSKPIIDSFFKRLEQNNYQFALDELLKQNEFIDQNDTFTFVLKNRFQEINLGSGKYKGRRLFQKKSFEDDLAIYAYFVKYDRKFYRFNFTFYNNGDKIRLYKFSFDDVLDSEIEESMKYQMIRKT